MEKPALLQRILGALPFWKRSFDAAAGGRRLGTAKRITNLNQTILAQSTLAAQRAAYQCRNNPWVGAGVTSLVTHIVGTGITPRSLHPDEKVREALQALWRQWVRQSDPSGRCTFYGQQALAVRRMIEGGEAVARMRQRRPQDGLAVPFQLETIDRSQLPLDLFRVIEGGQAVVRAGIEFNQIGARSAYHLFKTRPDDPFAPPLGLSGATTRVDARDMLHMFLPLEDGQLRGATWLLPVVPMVHELDQLQDAALVRAKIANMLVGFIRDAAGSAGQLGSNTSSEEGEPEIEIKLESGQVIRLPSSTDITFPEVPEFKDYAPFTKVHLRGIATGLGVPYPELAADYEGVTFSSARIDLMAYKSRIEYIQYSVVIPTYCQPVWERFVTLAVLTGAIPAPDFEANTVDYFACDWLPPKFEYVDPEKDIAAEVEAINNGLKSRTQALAERGYDVEQVDAQIAADREREKRLGLSFGAPAVLPAPADTPTPTPPDQETEGQPNEGNP